MMLAIGGVVLLGWLGWVLVAEYESSSTAPYHYEMVAEGQADQFPDLGLTGQTDLSIRQYELRAEGIDKPLAVLHAGSNTKNGSGQVLLNWSNQLAEPLITLSPTIDDLNMLSRSIEEHLPRGALVLGWWDTMRRLALVSNIETPLHENLGRPLLLPDTWSGHRAAVEQLENAFWSVPSDGTSRTLALFERLQTALLADLPTGVQLMRELTPDRDAYLVLHVTDAYKLGVLNPGKLGIGYRDFPLSGNMHTTIGHIKKWLTDSGYESYTVDKLSDTSVRVFFLTDEQSHSPLIAQVLPFTTSQPLKLEHIKVVYQYKGYWVYRIPPTGPEKES